jgi:hypothetical protein
MIPPFTCDNNVRRRGGESADGGAGVGEADDGTPADDGNAGEAGTFVAVGVSVQVATSLVRKNIAATKARRCRSMEVLSRSVSSAAAHEPPAAMR